MNIIELTNIDKIYGKDDAKVTALNKINLTIEEGELIAIMGASGSGKSTLLNILGLLDSQTNGNYLFKGDPLEKLKNNKLCKLRNEFFGFVVQNFALLKDYTVFENIRIPLEYKGIKNKEIVSRIDFLSKKLKIESQLKKTPKQLSGGQCQRVAIARALANNPRVILADEPTGALDSINGQNVISLFKDINKEGTTVIIVTHDIAVANQCNRIIELKDGNIINDNIKSTPTLSV